MITTILAMFLACGDKDEDTAVETTEPASEETTEDTGSVEDTGASEETGSEESGDTGTEETEETTEE